MYQFLLYAGGALLLAFAAFSLWVVHRYLFWKREGQKYTDASYVPPQATYLGRVFRCVAGRITAFLYLGPVRIYNKHHFQDSRRLLILPNHQTERDAVVIPRLLGLLKVRYLIASTQVTPSRATYIAFTGGISVHHGTAPGAAVRAASRALGAETDTSCVIFPEGELCRDGKMQREKFHDGAIVIGRLAERLSKTDFAALPVYIRYERDRSKAGWLQRTLLSLGLDRWRNFYGERTYGVDIYLGKPIALTDLPEKTSDATTRVFEEIVALSKAAKP